MTRTQRATLTPAPCRAVAASVPRTDLRRKQLGIRALALFVALAAAAMVAATASGQAVKYDVLDVEPLIDDNLATVQREARAYATTRDLSGFSQTKLAVVQRYFQQYVPAKITQPDATHQINDVMGHVRAVMDSAVRSQTPGAGSVMRWLYAGLKPVALGNYQPAARINAIQFIAGLSRPPAQRGGVPKPYSFVLTDLKTIYDDVNNPDGVRAAALKGIERYVRYSPSNDPTLQGVKDSLTQSMVQLLESDPPTGRDELAHAFLQRYAVSILTQMSTDATYGKQFVSISTNEDKPNLIALHSAAAIARLPGKMPEGEVETQEVLKQWSKRVLAAYQDELARLAKLEKSTGTPTIRQPAAPETFLKETKDPNEKTPLAPGMRGESMMGMDEMYDMDMEMDMGTGMEMEMDMEGMMEMSMMGMGMRTMAAKPQPAEIVASRKKLNYILQQVLLGVTGEGKVVEDVESIQATGGLMASTPADALDATKQWLTSLFDVTNQLNDTTLDTRRKYVTALQEQVATLEALAEGKAVQQRAAIDAPVFRFGNPLDPVGEAEAPADGEPAPAAPPAAAVPADMDALLN
ncbi:hypothetical protein Enr13x_45740 [Stieleria neptunia]|uniref:Uncharacterized protein n=1 Tax=Stieleria neptunia TaxID=2527979 RepID=A0A518HV22_9BACT|nr:hypothetical protein [Stieleria neptunia]QDV44706.1 hypothetical protein Enr13x_45740 [Stieleria neptunia]